MMNDWFESQTEEPVNLTPLIDVFFVVLAVFMIAASFLSMEEIKLAPGAKATQFSKSSSSVVIRVTKNNEVFVNSKQATLVELPLLLTQLYQKHHAAIPELWQDEGAFFGTYQQVKNALEQAGFRETTLILRKTDS